MFAIAALVPSTVDPTVAPVTGSKLSMSKICMAEGGKGFGGGEATRDPAPTTVDPNDPKGKQQAIHKAESFSDYLARRSGAPAAAPEPVAAATVPGEVVADPISEPLEGGKGFGGG